MTSVTTTVNNLAVSFLPCRLCGAQPKESCHIQGQKDRPIDSPHKMRTKPLWDVYGAGFAAHERLMREAAA